MATAKKTAKNETSKVSKVAPKATDTQQKPETKSFVEGDESTQKNDGEQSPDISSNGEAGRDNSTVTPRETLDAVEYEKYRAAQSQRGE